jgi:hypothetical protein
MLNKQAALISWNEYCTDFTDSPLGLLAIQPFIFTYGLMIGLEEWGYQYRYCYKTLGQARGALKDWKENNFEGEPEGYIKRK